MATLSFDPELLNRLKASLMTTLPGAKAHSKMASQVRLNELKFSSDASNAIKSSVLILLYPRQKQLYTTLILRQTYNGVHSGQVSFPGGRFEDTDSSLIQTALREAQEEVNIDPERVNILGSLSELYIPPSNFLVLPVVGTTDVPPDFRADVSEVAEIIESDLSFLFTESLRKKKIIQVRETEIEAPYYDVNGHTVWGATAMILSELKEIIESIT